MARDIADDSRNPSLPGNNIRTDSGALETGQLLNGEEAVFPVLVPGLTAFGWKSLMSKSRMAC